MDDPHTLEERRPEFGKQDSLVCTLLPLLWKLISCREWQKFKLPVERDQSLKPSAQDEIEKVSLVILDFLSKAPPIWSIVIKRKTVILTTK